MISVYRIFQMIFGTIASMFILIFLIQYTGVYSSLQEQSHSITILKNFNKVAGDVYLTGNPIDYHDFSNFDLDECFTFFNPPDSPAIKCGSIDYPTYIPMIFHSGNDVLIDASYIDMGWWKTNFLLVYPELKIIFNPVTNSLNGLRLMRNITSMFNCEWGVEEYACKDIKEGTPFPTMLKLQPRVKFGFCDGNTLRYEGYCGGKGCERYDFLNILSGSPTQFEICTANLPSKYFKVVTIAENCATIDKGVCIETSHNGVGEMKIAGSDKTFIYKDILDIMAVVIGGDEKSTFNRPIGETNYIFKNEIMSRRLSLAAKIEYEKQSTLEAQATALECIYPFAYSVAALCGGFDAICDRAKENYFDPSPMIDLRESMNLAENSYKELLRWGCVDA